MATLFVRATHYARVLNPEAAALERDNNRAKEEAVGTFPGEWKHWPKFYGPTAGRQAKSPFTVEHVVCGLLGLCGGEHHQTLVALELRRPALKVVG
jgi:hypothetical protein